jgi:hypothetical protein
MHRYISKNYNIIKKYTIATIKIIGMTELQQINASYFWSFRFDFVAECDATIRDDIDCPRVLEESATKYYVEGIIGRMSVQNESSGFASIVFYGLVAFAKLVDISYVKSIIPLTGATFTPTDENSFNEKVADIRMFSYDSCDYFEFGAFNFSSCALRSTTVSVVAKRPAPTIKSENSALDSFAVSLLEFDSDIEGKDPTYISPRAKTRKTVEYEEWDEDLFRFNEAKLGSKSPHHLCAAAPVFNCTIENDMKKPSAKSMPNSESKTSPSSRMGIVQQQFPRRGKVMLNRNVGYSQSRDPDVQSTNSSHASVSSVDRVRDVYVESKSPSPVEGSMKQVLSIKREALADLKLIKEGLNDQYKEVTRVCTTGEVRYFRTIKSYFEAESEKYSCKDRKLLVERECVMCINTLTVGEVMELKCCGCRRDGKGCLVHIHVVCFFRVLLQRFTSLAFRSSKFRCMVCNAYLFADDKVLRYI